MHRSLTLFFTGAALLWSSVCFAALGELGHNSGSNDNPHNLSSLSSTPGGETDFKASDTSQICVFCHTPHSATPKSTLWGRPAPTGPYGNGTFPIFDQTRVRDGSDILGIAEATILPSSQYDNSDPDLYPNGASKLCLSCHDGVTALGITLQGEFAVVPNLMPAGNSTINLETSHPISFTYTQAIADAINALPTKSATYTMPDQSIVPLDGESRVQCTICHEPHFDTKDATYGLPFWRGALKIDETADYNRICNECHTTDYYPQTDGPTHNIPVVP